MINHESTDLLIIKITCCLAANDEQREATTVGHAVAPGPNHSRMGKSCRTANNSRGQQLSMYLFEGGRGAVASTSAAPEQNELRKCQRDSLIKLTHFVIPLTRIKCSFEFHENV